VSEFPTTRICTASADDVTVRGKSLPHELMGHVTFTEMLFFQILGRVPTPDQVAVLDACLVALMEHGLTPSAQVARSTFTSAPEAMQGAVAAGLLGVGSLFAGTMEGCAAVLVRLVARGGSALEASRIAREHKEARRPVPGFGHPVHRPDDPRTVRLLDIAAARGVAGAHTAALATLSGAVDEIAGKHVPVNVTGAFAAVLLDADVPAEILRGFALISRCAGLVGHIHEEQHNPASWAVWEAAERAVPYADGE